MREEVDGGSRPPDLFLQAELGKERQQTLVAAQGDVVAYTDSEDGERSIIIQIIRQIVCFKKDMVKFIPPKLVF